MQMFSNQTATSAKQCLSDCLPQSPPPHLNSTFPRSLADAAVPRVWLRKADSHALSLQPLRRSMYVIHSSSSFAVSPDPRVTFQCRRRRRRSRNQNQNHIMTCHRVEKFGMRQICNAKQNRLRMRSTAGPADGSAKKKRPRR